MYLEVEQRTPEWEQARCGSLGASQVWEIKKSRTKLLTTLIAERLSGIPSEKYVTERMRWGIDHEPKARLAYELLTGASVRQCGIFRHPQIEGTHASPDGLVGEDGIVEIKCPDTATHVAGLLGAPIEDRYIAQMQWQMECSGRAWCDFVSYDPRLPPHLMLHVRRVKKNEGITAELAEEVKSFLDELNQKLRSLDEAGHSGVLTGAQDNGEKKHRVAPKKRIIQRIAIACDDPLFHRFLGVDTASGAAEAVRSRCKVSSRAEILEGTEAARIAHRLLEEFEAWKRS